MSFILNSCNSSSSGHRCCGNANQGSSVAISADGNTSVVSDLQITPMLEPFGFLFLKLKYVGIDFYLRVNFFVN